MPRQMTCRAELLGWKRLEDKEERGLKFCSVGGLGLESSMYGGKIGDIVHKNKRVDVT